jgi:UDP-hydrolysing UDP-N-acetyl-D-glucosamine 2-epimerase
VKRFCVVTTSRADYGLLRGLMRAIDEDPDLELQVVATAMHLAPEFGLTYHVIEEDGFRVDRKVDMLQSRDGETDMARSIGTGLIGFAAAIEDLRPDVVVLLGDRFELLAPAIAAFTARIPIAHIHGGETSEGALDEGVRHAVTKLAWLHFPATDAYRDRIIRMGEDPARVFAFGAPGLDALREVPLLDRHALERRLDFSLHSPVAIVTYHPVTLEPGSAGRHIEALLAALQQEGVRAVFTKANADQEGRLINRRLADLSAERTKDYRLYDNLGQMVYLSCLAAVDVMVGNSSSGLIEAPSFELPVVNIGDRQRGRIKAANVIDVREDAASIAAGIRQALSPVWQRGLLGMTNPYAGAPGLSVSARIKEELKRADIGPEALKKQFYDGPTATGSRGEAEQDT